jgi:hypothetical protein
MQATKANDEYNYLKHLRKMSTKVEVFAEAQVGLTRFIIN